MSPRFSPLLVAQSLSFRSLLLHPSSPSLSFSHLLGLEHPAFSRSPALTRRRDQFPGDPGPTPPPGPKPCPAPSAPGLTQKSMLKPSSRYLMHRRPPRKRPMLRPGRLDPESPGWRLSAGSSGSRRGGGGALGKEAGPGRGLSGAGPLGRGRSPAGGERGPRKTRSCEAGEGWGHRRSQ